jgi:hypothetical protein
MKLGIKCETEQEVYQNFQSIQPRHGIWNDVSKIMQMNSKDVIIYFHNIWTKQFYDDV